MHIRIYTVKVGDAGLEASRPAAGAPGVPGAEARPSLELTVRSGATLADVSRQLMGDSRATWELAVLNGVRDKDPLHPGQKIKVLARDGMR
jgi:nucleoid-associated protein YgaU